MNTRLRPRLSVRPSPTLTSMGMEMQMSRTVNIPVELLEDLLFIAQSRLNSLQGRRGVKAAVEETLRIVEATEKLMENENVANDH